MTRQDIRTADAAWRATRHAPALNRPTPRSTWNGRRTRTPGLLARTPGLLARILGLLP